MVFFSIYNIQAEIMCPANCSKKIFSWVFKDHVSCNFSSHSKKIIFLLIPVDFKNYSEKFNRQIYYWIYIILPLFCSFLSIDYPEIIAILMNWQAISKCYDFRLNNSIICANIWRRNIWLFVCIEKDLKLRINWKISLPLKSYITPD